MSSAQAMSGGLVDRFSCDFQGLASGVAGRFLKKGASFFCAFLAEAMVSHHIVLELLQRKAQARGESANSGKSVVLNRVVSVVGQVSRHPPLRPSKGNRFKKRAIF